MQKRLGWRFNQRHSIPDWVEHRFDGLRYARRVLVTRPQNLIGYWPQWEGNGVVSFDNSPQGNNGLYVGPTLAQLGIGDGRYSALYDGVNDLNNIFSAGLLAVINGVAGTLVTWVQVNGAGVWTDGAIRTSFDWRSDAQTDIITIVKTNVNGQLRYQYRAGGVDRSVFLATASPITWMALAMTWDKNILPTGEMRAYFNGAQVGVTQVGLGVWGGVFSGGFGRIGAIGAGSNWFGNSAPNILYDVALTPAEVLFVSTLG